MPFAGGERVGAPRRYTATVSMTPAELRARLVRLRSETGAVGVCVVDGAGRQVAMAGEVDEDVCRGAFRRMTAVGVAGSLVRERGHDFRDEARAMNVHARLVGGRLVLVVTYDGETATGRVVLSSRRADAEMAERVRDDDRYARVRPRDDES